MDGIGKAINAMFIMLIISVPLGVWKLIDIIIWCVGHLRITTQ